jgi:hypothetical protein
MHSLRFANVTSTRLHLTPQDIQLLSQVTDFSILICVAVDSNSAPRIKLAAEALQ